MHIMGGADVIRQALAGGHVDELTLIVAPLVLGGGKRLFEGSRRTSSLEYRESAVAARDVHRLRRAWRMTAYFRPRSIDGLLGESSVP